MPVAGLEASPASSRELQAYMCYVASGPQARRGAEVLNRWWGYKWSGAHLAGLLRWTQWSLTCSSCVPETCRYQIWSMRRFPVRAQPMQPLHMLSAYARLATAAPRQHAPVQERPLICEESLGLCAPENRHPGRTPRSKYASTGAAAARRLLDASDGRPTAKADAPAVR